MLNDWNGGWSTVSPFEYKISNDVHFPCVRYMGVQFFFVGSVVFARLEGADIYTEWEEFTFSRKVCSIKATSSGIRVYTDSEIKCVDEFLITGGPELHQMNIVRIQ